MFCSKPHSLLKDMIIYYKLSGFTHHKQGMKLSTYWLKISRRYHITKLALD